MTKRKYRRYTQEEIERMKFMRHTEGKLLREICEEFQISQPISVLKLIGKTGRIHRERPQRPKRHYRYNYYQKKLPTTLIERINWKITINPKTACWEWNGYIAATGYGAFHFKHKLWSAHRAMYEATFGEIPNGMQVCHHCDNKKCVNPAHLFVGTQQDNNKDRDKKGRRKIGLRGIPRIRIFTWEEVAKIRNLYLEEVSMPSIAKLYGCSYSTIHSIIRNKTYKVP